MEQNKSKWEQRKKRGQNTNIIVKTKNDKTHGTNSKCLVISASLISYQ